MTEGCSGRTGDLKGVRWYRVPGTVVWLRKQPDAGYWESHRNQIVLAGDETDNGVTVRHEMLHSLLQTASHPRAEFFGACASLVGSAGITDAGPWHAPSKFVVLPSESLTVASDAELLPPESDGKRWLALNITVRNQRGSAVLVGTPGDPAPPPGFMYDLRGPAGGISGGEVATDSSTLFFQPFEAKQWLFEFRVASDLTEHHVSPGTYHVRGAYARRWSAFETVAVSQ